MRSEERLSEYGIVTEWRNSKPYFSGLGKILIATLYGNRKLYKQVSLIMRDVEREEKQNE